MIQFNTQPDDLQLVTGIDIPVEELGITLRQPKVKDISMLGEINYFTALRIFTMTKEQLRIISPEVTNWMIFQKSLSQSINGIADTKILVSNFLQLFFNTPVIIGPRSLIITQKDEILNIEPEDFANFQQLIGNIGGLTLLSPAEEKFNPKNKRAAEIAEKMKKARQRLAKVKAVQEGRSGENENNGFLTRYIKTVAIATSNSLEQVCNMTLLQLDFMMHGYLAYEAYDLEVKSRLAGATSDKELVHWTIADSKQDSSIGQI